MGSIALAEFELLGGEHAERPNGGNRFDVSQNTGRPRHTMSTEQHCLLGSELRLVLQQLAGPWYLPKTHRRSVCRRRLRAELERLQSLASGCAAREHGDELAWRWYSDSLSEGE